MQDELQHLVVSEVTATPDSNLFLLLFHFYYIQGRQHRGNVN